MEIKFKRYHFNQDGVCYHVSTWGYTSHGFESINSLSQENKKLAIDCQYVGIQDNNGVDAYAGDTVKTPSYTGTIEYANDICCWIVRRPDTTFVRLEVVRFKGFEITGNAYINS
jgi:hypothetical protein